MAEDSVAPAGQAPASDQESQGQGQTPPGQAPEEEFDPQRARALIAKLREEARAAAKDLAAYQTAQKKAEDAKLSETERLSKKVTELEAANAATARTMQERVLRYEIQLQAGKLQIIDPDAAVKLLDLAQVEYDADGQPQNLDKALRALVKDKPYLLAPATGTASQPAASVTNPATRSALNTQTTRYTADQINDRPFYMEHREDIIRAMREGRIDP